MSGRKPLATPSDIAYVYDGGLKGFYSCVHTCVYTGKLPLSIQPAQAAQPTLLPVQWIETDEEKAARVRSALRYKVAHSAQELVETVFLSCMPNKELPMLRFMLLAFERGSMMVNHLQDPDVAALTKAARHLEGEAHLLKGFVRFSDVQGRLIAEIRPKNFVLPFLAEHFCDRYPNEAFMIYDKTNHAALIHAQGQVDILPMEAAPEYEASGEETMYREMWKQFYHTIGIKARYNPKCRMTHMPKRYWSEMTEMRDQL